MNRSEAKQIVAEYAERFASYMTIPLTLSFGKHSFTDVVIQSIQLAKITDMNNAPDKRQDENGKYYTPPVIQFNTNAGILYFVLEDINIAAIINGIRITTKAVQIDFRS